MEGLERVDASTFRANVAGDHMTTEIQEALAAARQQLVNPSRREQPRYRPESVASRTITAAVPETGTVAIECRDQISVTAAALDRTINLNLERHPGKTRPVGGITVRDERGPLAEKRRTAGRHEVDHL